MIRRIITFAASALAIAWGTAAQTPAEEVAGCEYWFDDNYQEREFLNIGYGTNSATIAYPPATGLHFLNMQPSLSDGSHGALWRKAVFFPYADISVRRIEYWLDDNVGDLHTADTGTFSVDIAPLSPGLHFFTAMPRLIDGSTGALFRKAFYVPSTLINLRGYRYWLDDAYIESFETPEASFTVDISHLRPGLRFLTVLPLYDDGTNGTICRKAFYVPGEEAPGAVRYWLDDDVANTKVVENGASATVNLNVDISNLGVGVHFFNAQTISTLGYIDNFFRRIFIVGGESELLDTYSYSFNSIYTYVDVPPSNPLTLDNVVIDIPQPGELVPLDIESLRMSAEGVATATYSTEVTFSLRGHTLSGYTTAPVYKTFDLNEEVSRTAVKLGENETVSFPAMPFGDFVAMEIELDDKGSYTLASSQPCDMRVYQAGTLVEPLITIGNEPIALPLPAGRYHCVLFNVPNDYEPMEVSLLNNTTTPVEIGYDGRYVTFACADDDAVIRYTLDGTVPDENSPVYDGTPIETFGLVKIFARAYREGYAPSTIRTYSTAAWYGGGDLLITARAGWLASALEWCSGSDGLASTLRVEGPLDDSDFSILRTARLRHLDLSEASIETVPDGAMAGTALISVQFPATVVSAGTGIVDGCENIAAVVWRTGSLTLTPAMLGSALDNPNLLVYANSENLAPEGAICVRLSDMTAERLTLTDGIGSFFAPLPFTAREASMTRYFGQTTEPGVCRGWETIALPFDVEATEHGVNGACAPFANEADMEAGYKPYWLFEIEPTGYSRSAAIKAYTPYVVAMPQNDVYADIYNLGGAVTFSASNAEIAATPDVEAYTTGVHTAWRTVAQSENVYAVNVGEPYGDRHEGSAWVLGLRDIKPFEAFRFDSAPSRRAIPLFEGESSGIFDLTIPVADSGLTLWTQGGTLHLLSSTARTVEVYTTTGALAARAQLAPDEEATIDNLAAGIYIAAGQKIVIAR